MYFYRNGLPVYKEMKWLADVKRFSMAVMFLSEKDKKGKFLTIIARMYLTIIVPKFVPSEMPALCFGCGIIIMITHNDNLLNLVFNLVTNFYAKIKSPIFCKNLNASGLCKVGQPIFEIIPPFYLGLFAFRPFVTLRDEKSPIDIHVAVCLFLWCCQRTKDCNVELWL